MTKIKLCGLMRPGDIDCANTLAVDYAGFVFYDKSKRYVSHKTAEGLKSRLSENIKAVGVFVDEDIDTVASLLDGGIIDIAQLHGNEDDEYIKKLQSLSKKPVIKAFRISSEKDIKDAQCSLADMVLLDSGAGSGMAFDWDMTDKIKRPYFLAGGLDCENVSEALSKLGPYAVDVSSGIETDGIKDHKKMRDFVSLVRSYKQTD